MRHGGRILSTIFAGLIGVAALAGAVSAQDAGGDIRQMKLTEAQIQSLIAAQPDLAAIANRLEALPEDAEVSVEKELDAIAAKHGFKDFTELDDVSANVQLVLDGLDPETGDYTDPVEGLKSELEEVKADTNMPADEKKELIAELEEALSAIPKLENPENIALVKKHQKGIQDALDAGEGKP